MTAIAAPGQVCPPPTIRYITTGTAQPFQLSRTTCEPSRVSDGPAAHPLWRAHSAALASAGCTGVPDAVPTCPPL